MVVSLDVLGVLRELAHAELAPASNDRSRMLDLVGLVLKSSGLGFWSFDTARERLEWDATLHNIYGIPEEGFAATFATWEEAVLPEDLPSAKSALAAHLESDSSDAVVFRIRRPNGDVRWLQSWAVAQRDERGHITTMLGASRDLTSEKQLEQALLRSHKLEAVGRLVGGVAHDFNNLLSVALGSLELLQESTDPTRSTELIESALGAVDRGADLTRHLLSLVRREPLSPTTCDVLDILRENERMLRRVLPETITLRVKNIDPGLRMTVDRNLLDNALLNLALNSRDAMPGGGELTLGATLTSIQKGARLPPGSYLSVFMEDTGQGMEPEIVKQAAEPFFTTKGAGAGSGLGLPMVIGFTRQSRGDVVIESTPGRGTRVALVFPLAVSDPAEIPNVRTHEVVPPPPRTILLVEDDPSVRRSTRAQLESLGQAVHVASEGREALQMLRDGLRPAVLISDVVLPGSLQGPELIRSARHLVPDLEVLLVSGYPAGALSDSGEGPSVDGVLAKPLSLDTLARSLQELFHARRT